MNTVLRSLALVAVSLLAACATPGGQDKAITTWDLGPAPAAPAAPAATVGAAVGNGSATTPGANAVAVVPGAVIVPGSAGAVSASAVARLAAPGSAAVAAGLPRIALPRPIVMLPDVTAPAWLDNHYVTYRLAYAEAQQPRPYAQARWSMTPAQLFQQRARERLAHNASVLSAGDVAQGMLLKLELEDFSQIFDTAETSRATVQVRATLLNNGRLVAQRGFTVVRPAPSANAAGAVRALAAATDALLDELAAWTVAPPALRR